MTDLIPNIELMLPREAINSLANVFYTQGIPPIDAAVYISSRPFTFDGNVSPERYIVRNMTTGDVTVNYPGTTMYVRVHGSEVIYVMDNGDVLNISKAMRSIGKAVFERLIVLFHVGGHPN